MSIIESNKLIAEFIGYTNNYWYINDELTYHSDWNKLMPIVDRIENLGYRVYIDRGGGHTQYCKIKNGKINIADCYSHNTKIEAVYKAIIDFIIYTNNKK